TVVALVAKRPVAKIRSSAKTRTHRLRPLWAEGHQPSQGEQAMTYFDIQQQNPAHSQFNPQGFPQAGQPYGAWSNMPLMQAMGGHGFGGYGQGGYGQGQAAFGQAPRQLSQQDVNEVVRQLLPIVPQIVGMLQNQPQLQYAAMLGGQGFGQQGFGQQGLGQLGLGQQGFGQQGLGQYGLGQYGQGGFGTPFGAPQFQSAFGGLSGWGQQQRQLTQQDVADVTRQLIGVIPQVIGNLQAFNQQRMI